MAPAWGIRIRPHPRLGPIRDPTRQRRRLVSTRTWASLRLTVRPGPQLPR
jgi:hypothetical protein